MKWLLTILPEVHLVPVGQVGANREIQETKHTSIIKKSPRGELMKSGEFLSEGLNTW